MHPLPPAGHFLNGRYAPLLDANLQEPYPAYNWLQEYEPIHWGATEDGLPESGRWYITRYNHVMEMLRDPRFGREPDVGTCPMIGAEFDTRRRGAHQADTGPTPNPGEALGAVERLADSWMILRDPPAHTHLRELVSHAYTPRRVAGYEQEIVRIVDALLDELLERGKAGSPVDLLAEFALPLTVRMTAHVLGLPQEDEAHLAAWSRTLATLIDLNQDAESQARSREAARDAMQYLGDHVRRCKDRAGDDVLSRLANHPAGVGDEEILGSLTHLLFVGNDPVMHMIGNAVMVLDRDGAAKRWFCEHPEAAEAVVDECMRFDSPVQMTFRFALADMEWHGTPFRTGAPIALVLGAANRDPARFAEPHRLDFERRRKGKNEGGSPLPAHFGMGIHYCLGAPLARLEGQIALQRLYARFPNLYVDVGEGGLVWQRTAAVRGVMNLPVCLGTG